MKIIHSSGEELDTGDDLRLEMERSNPFFNDFGEQSLPVTLPPTDKNRRLLGFPDDMAGIAKMELRAEATIRHGVFSSRCRQAILSASRDKGIETSFYLNLGSFYEKIKDVPLSAIFDKKDIKFLSVREAIEFCENLRVERDDRFACFPVAIDSGSINRLRYDNGEFKLYNDQPRTETVDEKTIAIDPGFYISPFIRGNHLLSLIFDHFGYKMNENFFTRTTPFQDMVFLNNTIDTIVTSSIRYSQIVPDCMATTILDVYRNKFCCEFIPNEVDKTMDVVLFDDVLLQEAETDFTCKLSGMYTVSYPESFRRLILSCDHVSANEEETHDGEEFKSLPELLKKYPNAELDNAMGEILRIGFRGKEAVRNILGYATIDYDSGGPLKGEKKESPDAAPTMTRILFAMGGPRSGSKAERRSGSSLAPYIGKGRALNSSIVMGGDKSTDTDEENTETKESSDNELRPMLCFVARDTVERFEYGTILNRSSDGERLWDHTLAYHGEDGLFERFWRKYDTMLRNSLLEVQANIKLDEAQKMMISAHRKVIIDGQELLPDVLRYTLPDEMTESTFLTVKAYEPVSLAEREESRFQLCPYKWKLKYSYDFDKDLPNGAAGYRYVNEPQTFYPDPPTKAQYEAGGRYHPCSYPAEFWNYGSVGSTTGKINVWLEPALRDVL